MFDKDFVIVCLSILLGLSAVGLFWRIKNFRIDLKSDALDAATEIAQWGFKRSAAIVRLFVLEDRVNGIAETIRLARDVRDPVKRGAILTDLCVGMVDHVLADGSGRKELLKKVADFAIANEDLVEKAGYAVSKLAG